MLAAVGKSRRGKIIEMKNLRLLLFFLLVCSLFFVAYPTEASTYKRDSPVKELTPQTIAEFISSHKPVVILFYAPWCGHCQRFHPEYARFAEAVKGIARVGAFNADSYPELAQRFGISGFPTIKYWKMGEKVAFKTAPADYNGQRTAGSLQAYVTKDIVADKVTVVKTIGALKKLIQNAPLKAAAVLISGKNTPPAMFNVMSYSPKLSSLPFVFLGSRVKDDEIMRYFSVTKLPTVALVSLNEDKSTTEDTKIETFNEKKIDYPQIAKFYMNALEKISNISLSP